MSAIWGCCSAPVIGNSGALWTGLVRSWSPNSFTILSFPSPTPLGLLVGLWGARSFPILPPPPWLACRSMRSQVFYYPFPPPPPPPPPPPLPWLACRSMRSQVLFYPPPTPPDLLVGLWGVRSFTIISILPPLPWLACRSMRSQVLSYPSPPPDLLVGLWGVRSSTILSHPSPHSPGLLVGLWGARSFPILPPPPWLACRSMRSQVLYFPFPSFPTPLACL